LVDADIGDRIYLKINPTGGTKEIISCDKILTTTTAFTDCIRGYVFYANTASTTLVKQHSAGETIIISNDDHYLRTQYAGLDANVRVKGNWIFDEFAVSNGETPTTSFQYATKIYVDQVATSVFFCGFPSVNVHKFFVNN